LLSDGKFFVTDFDGNPILPAAQRILPIPAAQDVAGMVQSLAHAAIVARKHTDLNLAAVAEVDGASHQSFLRAYEVGVPGRLYDPGPLRAFRMQQVLREIVYAAKHLPRWMYVPDAALPALLDEEVPT
jgi:maltokinase